MTTKRIKRRRANIVRGIIFTAALIVFCVSAYQLLMIYLEYKKGSDEYDALAGTAQEYFAEMEAEELLPDGNDTAGETKAADDTLYREFHQTMLAENEDYVGWITVEGTKINYPIVQFSDNDYYLTHTFEGETNAAGTLFVDCNIYEGMEAKNVIVYGHNMKNGSMFANLKKYRDDEFYQSHKTFKVYTETGIYDYEVFAVYVTAPDSDTYTIGFADDAAFMSYVEKMQGQSLQNTGVTVNPGDQIITLSTCVNNNVDRLVVQARRLEN